MATRILKANFADAYDLRIETQWMQGYGEPEHEFQQVYATKNITKQDTRFSHVTPFGRWSRKDSTSATIPYDTIYQGLAKVVALAKSQVINGENLNAIRRMATLCKQAIAGQQQRLTPVTA
jgi:hypothetical protein